VNPFRSYAFASYPFRSYPLAGGGAAPPPASEAYEFSVYVMMLFLSGVAVSLSRGFDVVRVFLRFLATGNECLLIPRDVGVDVLLEWDVTAIEE
jgi:hypothetical protein